MLSQSEIQAHQACGGSVLIDEMIEIANHPRTFRLIEHEKEHRCRRLLGPLSRRVLDRILPQNRGRTEHPFVASLGGSLFFDLSNELSDKVSVFFR